MTVKNKKLVASNEKIATLRSLLEKAKPKIAQVLPAHLAPEKMVRIVLAYANRNPNILSCSAMSILNSVMISSQLGLEPDGTLGLSYLVPYFNSKTKSYDAQFQIGYRGLMELAYRSTKIWSIEAHIVYKGDHFRQEYGLNQILEHRVNFDKRTKEIVCVYAIARFSGEQSQGRYQYDVMSKEEVDRIKNLSKAKDKGPWVDHYEEMARKTVVKRLCKYLPLSVDLRTALKFDNEAEEEQAQENVFDAEEFQEFEEFDEQDKQYKKVDSAIDRITQQLENQQPVREAYDEWNQTNQIQPTKGE